MRIRLLLLFAPLMLASCGSESAAADAREADLPGGATAPIERPAHTNAAEAAEVPELSARHGLWNARLGSVVERFRSEAVRLARGKASARDIRVSVHVRDLESDAELAFVDADVARAPASNMKLVTTAAALVLFGPGTEFMTPFEALGPIRGGTLEGDLVARASGDPIAGVDDDARVESRLDDIARQLRAAGIQRITGDIVLDEGSFAEPGPAPGWPDASQYWQEHCALAGGFSINGGVLQARVTPGRSGGPATVAVHPSPHGLASNYGVSTGGKKLDVRVGATRTAVTVRGTLPANRPPFLAEFSHPDPVNAFGAVLLDRLQRGGVRVDGVVRRVRHVAAGRRVAELRSSVDATLVPINADSRNSVADQLFFAIGHSILGEGTRAAGEAACRRALEHLGVSTDGFRQVDGSGLSRDNRVTARQLSALIAGVLGRGRETGETFRASLAVAGERGTLEDRMRDTPAAGHVFGKTGWIRGVSSLSGIGDAPDGSSFAFSILVEYPPSISGLNTKCFKPMQDELLVVMLAGAPEVR